jgi:hypothetical protein
VDRRNLQEELNRINDLYQQQDLKLRKAGGTDAQRQALRDMLNSKKQKLMLEMGDSLQQLNAGADVKISGSTISKGVDQSGLPDVAKQTGLGKFKKLFSGMGRKVAGIVPGAGAGMALLSGEPAMAAEELGEDAVDLAAPIASRLGAGAAAGPLGLAATGAYEALKSGNAGSAEDDAMIRAERDAQKNYMKSKAFQDARASKEKQGLKTLQGDESVASEAQLSDNMQRNIQMKNSDMDKFRKLLGLIKNKQAPEAKLADPNAGLDANSIKQEDAQRQIQMIDAKIAQLEESQDPNALESLNFWKNKRAELSSVD